MREVVHEMFSEEQIKEKIVEIAEQINKKYGNEALHVIGVLKGSIFFLTELTKHLTMPVTLDFIAAGSYGDGTVSSGSLSVDKDLDDEIDDLHCLVVEDIVDTGNTLSKIRKMLTARNPASIEFCALLDKPDRRETQVDVEYTGFVIPDEFVVGYGLDYAQRYRNLPYIGSLEWIED